MSYTSRFVVPAWVFALLLFVSPVTVCAGVQSYAIDDAESTVTFSAHSTGHDFQGKTSQISGRFGLDRAHFGESAFGEIHIAVRSIHTGISARDTAMYEHISANQYPEIIFRVQRFLDILTEGPATYAGQLVGELSIKGVTKAMPIAFTVTFADDQRVVISGGTPLRMTDFNITPPGFLVFRVAEEVQVAFRIVGKAQ